MRNVENIRLYRLGFPQAIPCGEFAEISGELCSTVMMKLQRASG
jgi:hypothetical protein